MHILTPLCEFTVCCPEFASLQQNVKLSVSAVFTMDFGCLMLLTIKYKQHQLSQENCLGPQIQHYSNMIVWKCICILIRKKERQD